MFAALVPVALALGVGLTLVQRRGLPGLAADLRVELQRLSEVQVAVAEVRTAAAEARSSARAVQHA